MPLYYHATDLLSAKAILAGGVLRSSENMPGFYTTLSIEVLGGYGSFVVQIDPGSSRIYDVAKRGSVNFSALRVSLVAQYGKRVLREPWLFQEDWWRADHFMALSYMVEDHSKSPVKGRGRMERARFHGREIKVGLWAVRRLGGLGYDAVGDSVGDEGVTFFNTAKCRVVPPLLFNDPKVGLRAPTFYELDYGDLL